jgi:hypothetical protein
MKLIKSNTNLEKANITFNFYHSLPLHIPTERPPLVGEVTANFCG